MREHGAWQTPMVKVSRKNEQNEIGEEETFVECGNS